MQKRSSKKILLAKILLIAAQVALLISCDSKEQVTHKATAPIIIEVKAEASSTHLYYEGKINPLGAIPVISPFEGEITHLLIHAGDTVKEGQYLARINSSQLVEDFRRNLSNYFQAKNSHERAKENFLASKALHKAGVISEEEFFNAQANLDSSNLDFIQAKQQLDKIIRSAKLEKYSIDNLKLQNSKQINQLLNADFNELTIQAPYSGLILRPPSTDTGQNDKNEITAGSHIRAGQVLWQIADPLQLGVVIYAHESDINRIQAGQQAIITGSGFMGRELSGKVIEVASEAIPQNDNSNNLSLFKVIIMLNTTNKALLNNIRVGMSAKVDIIINQGKQIKIPIKAIYTENNVYWVDKLNDNNQIEKTRVYTGETGLNDVTILRGLQNGDKVILHE